MKMESRVILRQNMSRVESNGDRENTKNFKV
jgi:hypothetical protein